MKQAPKRRKLGSRYKEGTTFIRPGSVLSVKINGKVRQVELVSLDKPTSERRTWRGSRLREPRLRTAMVRLMDGSDLGQLTTIAINKQSVRVLKRVGKKPRKQHAS